MINNSMKEKDHPRRRESASGSLSGRRSSDSTFEDILAERSDAENDHKNNNARKNKKGSQSNIFDFDN